jgi:zinc protease
MPGADDPVDNADMTKRHICVAALAAALGGGPPLSAQAPAEPPPAKPLLVPYTEFTLGNGLHVILHQDKTVPVAAVNVWYHVGSAREKPGRTGFAHLFEHVMFEGSEHVKEGEFDSWLEAAGGNNNGSTSEDRTNYITDVPSNALELALFLESDRMGYLLPTLDESKLDRQRDVVKNEKRQRVDNAPYGQAFVELSQMLYPKGHPYSWPVIGSMEDLSAARLTDVVEFFKAYYAPNNASLVVAGDIDVEATRALVEKWFGGIPRGPEVPPLTPAPASLSDVVRKTITDKVQLPRLYLAWHTPSFYAPGDAAMDMVSSLLTGGKNSRLYKRLVYDMQIAQDVTAAQQSQALGSVFLIMATARPGQSLDKIREVIDEELATLRQAPPQAREMTRALNQIEASFYSRMERTGSFGGKADQLNAYYTATGTPDYFQEDLARYHALSATDIQSAASRFLPAGRRVELSVVPEPQGGKE